MTGVQERGSGRAITDWAPSWLLEAVRPAPASPPWGQMTLSLIAVVAPPAVAVGVGRIIDGTLPAMGSLVVVAADQGGSYRARSSRFAVVAIAGAAGLLVGGYVRELGWCTVPAIAMVALLVALLGGSGGGTGSIAGLNLLVTSVVATGMPQAGVPWRNALLFMMGACWTVLLVLVVWPLHPTGPERAAVAEAYRALAGFLRAPSAADDNHTFSRARRTAYETVLAGRSWSAGSLRERTKLVALLNQSSIIRDARVALDLESIDVAPKAALYAEQIADAIIGKAGTPASVPADEPLTPARRALRSALTGAAELLDGSHLRDESLSAGGARSRRPLRTILEMRTSRLLHVYALRLSLCMSVAGAVSELFGLQRSYWVMLTVAVVLKPDFGSVFARAVQRGLGTIVGAGAGAVLLASTRPGSWLLLPMAILAFVMPYGKRRNWGLFSTFQTPLVILFIDLPAHIGWRLAEIRLIDTAVGCVIVLVVGYLPWPGSRQAPVEPRLADTLDAIAAYLDGAFCAGEANLPQLRRTAYDRLADLRMSFQRAITEPAALSRHTLAWWPAVIAAERALDVVTATVVRTAYGAAPPAIDGLADAVHGMAVDIRAGHPVRDLPQPADDRSRPLTDATRGIHYALGDQEL